MVQMKFLVLFIFLRALSAAETAISTESNAENILREEKWIRQLHSERGSRDWKFLKSIFDIDMILALTDYAGLINRIPILSMYFDHQSAGSFSTHLRSVLKFAIYLLEQGGLSQDVINESIKYCQPFRNSSNREQNRVLSLIDQEEISKDEVDIFSVMKNHYNESGHVFFETIKEKIIGAKTDEDTNVLFCLSFQRLENDLRMVLENIAYLNFSSIRVNFDPKLVELFKHFGNNISEIISSGLSKISYNESKIFFRLARQMVLQAAINPVNKSNFFGENLQRDDDGIITDIAMYSMSVKFPKTDENEAFFAKLANLYLILHDYTYSQSYKMDSLLKPLQLDPTSFEWFDFDYGQIYTENEYKACIATDSHLISTIECLKLTKSDRLQKFSQNNDSDLAKKYPNKKTYLIVIGMLAVTLVIVLSIVIGLVIKLCHLKNARGGDHSTYIDLKEDDVDPDDNPLIHKSNDDEGNETSATKL